MYICFSLIGQIIIILSTFNEQKIIFQIVIDENEVSSTHIEYLYWRYAKLMLPPPLESIFYKHYILDDSKDLKPGLTVDSVITIQENSSIVSEGTTGLVTWEVINILSSRRLEQALDVYHIIMLT